MNLIEWLEKNQFDIKTKITYCIVGNTYPHKEYLKQQGCVFDALLKWHRNHSIKVPLGCQIVPINFDKIYQWNNELQKPTLFKNAETWLQGALNPSCRNYEFLGQINQRIYDLPVTLVNINNFISQSGQFTYIYTFETDKNKIIWFTTKELSKKIGFHYILTATVVRHQNYKGDDTTVVNRCVLK